MNSYIVSNLDECDKGGVGHVFNDVVTSYIIGELYGLTALHYPINTDQFHGTDNWEEFFKFYTDQPVYSDYRELETFNFCDPPHNDGHGYFYYFSKPELDKWFKDPKPDTVYQVTRSNRVLTTDVFVWEKKELPGVPAGTHDKICNLLKAKYRKVHPYQKHSDKTMITVHIRRRDQYCSHQEEYSAKVLQFLQDNLTKPAEVKIFTNGDMHDIDQFIGAFSNITLPITVEVHSSTKTFELLADADINIMGRSAFPKLAGLFSDKIKIYQPGYIGNRNTNPTLGLEVEDRDDLWSKVDVHYDFNREHLLKLINEHGL